MMLISDLKKTAGSVQSVSGECAKCQRLVYELTWLLDDAYNVWIGKCPYCGSLNYLSTAHGLRGYDSGGMHLVLPTDEEAKANDLPEGTPTSGPCGRPADMHGSPLGEICHKIREGTKAP